MGASSWMGSLHGALLRAWPRTLPPRRSGEGAHPEVTCGIYRAGPRPLGLAHRLGAWCLICWLVGSRMKTSAPRDRMAHAELSQGSLTDKGGAGVVCHPTPLLWLSKTPFVPSLAERSPYRTAGGVSHLLCLIKLFV